jgi:hypothetical protein
MSARDPTLLELGGDVSVLGLARVARSTDRTDISIGDGAKYGPSGVRGLRTKMAFTVESLIILYRTDSPFSLWLQGPVLG